MVTEHTVVNTVTVAKTVLHEWPNALCIGAPGHVIECGQVWRSPWLRPTKSFIESLSDD
jgi:hypothetical protein